MTEPGAQLERTLSVTPEERLRLETFRSMVDASEKIERFGAAIESLIKQNNDLRREVARLKRELRARTPATRSRSGSCTDEPRPQRARRSDASPPVLGRSRAVPDPPATDGGVVSAMPPPPPRMKRQVAEEGVSPMDSWGPWL